MKRVLTAATIAPTVKQAYSKEKLATSRIKNMTAIAIQAKKDMVFPGALSLQRSDSTQSSSEYSFDFTLLLLANHPGYIYELVSFVEVDQFDALGDAADDRYRFNADPDNDPLLGYEHELVGI